jgi:hypothetical protein
MNEIQIQNFINKQNSQSLEAFSGLSPTQMHNLLYFPFSENSIIQLADFNDYHANAPILKMVLLLLETLKNEGELKLTPKGALPNKIVEKLYKANYITDEFDDIRSIKQFSEHQFFYATLTRILCELSPYCKKRNNKLSTTKTYDSAIINPSAIFNTIFEIYTSKFNWAYLDGFESEDAGQFGIAYTIYLLLYSTTNTIDPKDIYNKFIKAFPSAQFDNIRYYEQAYKSRVQHFLKLFGIIQNKVKTKEDLINIFTNSKWDIAASSNSFFKTNITNKI